MSRPGNEPDKSPLTQSDQPNSGAIHGQQRPGEAGRGADRARGSEPATRGNGRGR